MTEAGSADRASRRRVVFFGSGEFGLPTLKRLAERGEIAAIVTQPDRPAGRGGKTTPTPIGAWAADRLPDIPIFKPERVADEDVQVAVRSIAGAAAGDPRVCYVVIAFGQKMPATLLKDVFAVNLHASLLPRWRGAAPIHAAILAGDLTTGNSVITLAERMDAGLVLGQTSRPIDPAITAGELHDVLAADGPALVERVLEEWERGEAKGAKQDETRVTKAGKLRKDQGWIDFSEDAEGCRRRVHGLTPWPGVTVRFRGEDVKLLRVRVDEGSSRTSRSPGEVVDARQGVIACGNGTSLTVLEVQPAGKKGMRWDDYANGRRVADGERLEGRSAPC